MSLRDTECPRQEQGPRGHRPQCLVPEQQNRRQQKQQTLKGGQSECLGRSCARDLQRLGDARLAWPGLACWKKRPRHPRSTCWRVSACGWHQERGRQGQGADRSLRSGPPPGAGVSAGTLWGCPAPPNQVSEPGRSRPCRPSNSSSQRWPGPAPDEHWTQMHCRGSAPEEVGLDHDPERSGHHSAGTLWGRVPLGQGNTTLLDDIKGPGGTRVAARPAFRGPTVLQGLWGKRPAVRLIKRSP